MSKQRTHLTPEEVQGIEHLFEDSSMVWRQHKTKEFTELSQRISVDLENVFTERTNKSEGANYPLIETIPAPNLQEVLGVLDEVYRTKGSQWMWALNPLHSKYVCSIGMIAASNCIRGVGNNPLTAVINALRQLCKNHPKTLTKTE